MEIGRFHEIARATKRLEASTSIVQTQVFELTRGFSQLLAWNNYVPKKVGSNEIAWEGYNKCLILIKLVESLPMTEEDRALFYASGAKIRLKKLEYFVAHGSLDDSEKEEKLRKIYDLFMQSKSIRNRKQCRLEIAGLILSWKFSPTGSLAKDYEIAERMLPYPKPRVGLVSVVAASAVEGLAHLDDSLPNGNLATLREE